MNSQRKRLPSPPWQYVATFISHCNALPAIEQCIAAGAWLPGSHRRSALGLVRVHYIATDQIHSDATRKIRKKNYEQNASVLVSTCFNAFYFAQCTCWWLVTVCMYGMCLHKDVTVQCKCSLKIIHMDEAGCANVHASACVYVCQCVCVCMCVYICTMYILSEWVYMHRHMRTTYMDGSGCAAAHDELSGHGYNALPKRYQKSDALQVQFFWVGVRRSDNWDP